ncbi:MAG: hypothetical protein ABIN35_05490 [candidate division WOR-3 bacterium]
MKHPDKILISKFIDNEIEDERKFEEIKKHLSSCDLCRKIYEQYLKVNKLVKGVDLEIFPDLYGDFVEKKVNTFSNQKNSFKFSLSFAFVLVMIFVMSFSITLLTGRKSIEKKYKVAEKKSVVEQSFSSFLSEDYSNISKSVNYITK